MGEYDGQWMGYLAALLRLLDDASNVPANHLKQVNDS
jgi:hypothetical protein